MSTPKLTKNDLNVLGLSTWECQRILRCIPFPVSITQIMACRGYYMLPLQKKLRNASFDYAGRLTACEDYTYTYEGNCVTRLLGGKFDACWENGKRMSYHFDGKLYHEAYDEMGNRVVKWAADHITRFDISTGGSIKTLLPGMQRRVTVVESVTKGDLVTQTTHTNGRLIDVQTLDVHGNVIHRETKDAILDYQYNEHDDLVMRRSVPADNPKTLDIDLREYRYVYDDEGRIDVIYESVRGGDWKVVFCWAGAVAEYAADLA